MDTAKHDDVVRLFPGIEDHVVLDVLSAGPTVGELEAALLVLQGDDDALVEFRQQHGDRLNRLVGILEYAGIRPPDEPES